MLQTIKTLIFRHLKKIYRMPLLYRLAAPLWQRLYQRHFKKEASPEDWHLIKYTPAKAENPDYFIITSAGQNGSLWLGSSLHLHPEIICSCGYDAPPISLHYSHNETEWEAICNAYRTERDFAYGCMDRFLALKRGIDAPARKPELYNYVLEELESLPKFKNARIIGNVHAVHAHQLYALSHDPKNAMGGRFLRTRSIDLVRHPVTRLDSVINLVKQRMEIAGYLDPFKAEIESLTECMRDLERDEGADFSDPLQKAYFFVEYVQKTSQGWAADAHVMPSYPRIIFERARTDQDYFSWIVNYISGEKIKADQDYLKTVFTDSNRNAGRISGRPERKESPYDAYNDWPEWVRKDFARTCHKLRLQEKYDQCGYDLSFVAS